MRRKIWLVLLLCVLVSVEASSAEDGDDSGGVVKAKRRKIRRKLIAKNPTSTEKNASTPGDAEVDEAGKNSAKAEAVSNEDGRDARGFLDQYYQQFEQRIQPSIGKAEAAAANVQSQLRDSGHFIVPKGFDSVKPQSLSPNQVIGKAQVHQQQQLAAGSNEDVELARLHAALAGNQNKRTFNNYVSSGQDAFYGDSGLSSSYSVAKQPASKYFGVATTTTQDIQLGLTFTVPFLSIPLRSLTNIFDGGFNGLSGVNDFFNLDSSNLITLAVIALGAIFILPIVIYWLTGVNLSAFNWGRSDDPTYLTELADNVDTALRRYDIDARQCTALSICKQLKKRQTKATAKEEPSMTEVLTYGMVKSALKTETVRKFLGRKSLQEVERVADSTYNCEDVYQESSCPWDKSTSKKIVSKLILESDLDLSTLASLAVEGAKAFA